MQKLIRPFCASSRPILTQKADFLYTKRYMYKKGEAGGFTLFSLWDSGDSAILVVVVILVDIALVVVLRIALGVRGVAALVAAVMAAAAGRALSYYLARRRFDRLLERLRAHDPEPTQAQEQDR